MKAIRPRQEEGVTLILVALMMVVFIAMAALAIDIGVLYTARTSAQHAADAAALAGAYEFALPCYTTPGSCPGYDVEAAIKARAKQMAVQNSILRDPVVIADGDINVDLLNQRVTVNVVRNTARGNPVPTFFARVISKNSANIGATAEAEAGVAGPGAAPTTSHCLKPIFLPNTILSDPAIDTTIQKACDAGHVIFDSTGKLTTWASTQFNQSMLVRPADPKNALAPSQFYSLDFGDATTGHGASTYECALGRCLNQCGIDLRLTCKSPAVLDTKTGNMVGPTLQGINQLIGIPPDTDSWINGVSPSLFQLASGGTSPSSRSLAVAPVWDNCNHPIGSGTTYSAPVLGFVRIFVDSVNQGIPKASSKGDVTAHILGQTDCGDVDDGGSDPGPTAGPLIIPIRLVQKAKQ